MRTAKETVEPLNPAKVEYEHARKLMNAQELGYPVVYKEKTHYVQEFTRCQDPCGSGLKTYVYLFGLPNMVPADEVTITERPQ